MPFTERSRVGAPAGADHEGRRHRHAERRHARQVPGLGTEDLGPAVLRKGLIALDEQHDTGVQVVGPGAHSPTRTRLKASRRTP